METVGNSQKSGIRRGCGYDESPLPGPCWTSWRKLSSCCSVSRALEERAGVDAGRGVALDVDLVAAAGVVLAAEEVVEADFVEAGAGLVGGDVAADLEALAVRVADHHRGVPPDERADPALDVLVAGEPRLALRRDGVDVVGAAQRGYADLHLPGPLEQPQHDVARALATAVVDQGVEGVDPVGGLVGIDVGQLGRQALVDDGGCCRRGTTGTLRGSGLAGLAGHSLFRHPCILARSKKARNLPMSTRTGTGSVRPSDARGAPGTGAGLRSTPGVR